jgi:hypothetical protein
MLSAIAGLIGTDIDAGHVRGQTALDVLLHTRDLSIEGLRVRYRRRALTALLGSATLTAGE